MNGVFSRRRSYNEGEVDLNAAGETDPGSSRASADKSFEFPRVRRNSAQYWSCFHKSPWSLDPEDSPPVSDRRNGSEMQHTFRWRRLFSAPRLVGARSGRVEISLDEGMHGLSLAKSDDSSSSEVTQSPRSIVLPVQGFSPVPCPPNPGSVEMWDEDRNFSRDLTSFSSGSPVACAPYGSGESKVGCRDDRDRSFEFATHRRSRSKSLDLDMMMGARQGISSAQTLHGESDCSGGSGGELLPDPRGKSDPIQIAAICVEDSARRETPVQTKRLLTDYCELVLRSSSYDESMCFESDEAEGPYLFMTFGGNSPDVVGGEWTHSPETGAQFQKSAEIYFHDAMMNEGELEDVGSFAGSVFESARGPGTQARSSAMGRLIFDTRAAQEQDLRAFLNTMASESHSQSPQQSPRLAATNVIRLTDSPDTSSDSLEPADVRDVPIPRDSGMHRRTRSGIGGTVRFESPEPKARELLRHFLDSDRRKKCASMASEVNAVRRRQGTEVLTGCPDDLSVSSTFSELEAASTSSQEIETARNGANYGSTSMAPATRRDAFEKESSRESSPFRSSREFRMAANQSKLFPWRRRLWGRQTGAGANPPRVGRAKGWLLRMAVEQADEEVPDRRSDRSKEFASGDSDGLFSTQGIDLQSRQPDVMAAGVRVLRPRKDAEDQPGASGREGTPSPVPPVGLLCCAALGSCKVKQVSVSVSQRLAQTIRRRKE